MILALSLRPEALPDRIRGPLWDPPWFLIQESISFPLWFAVGVYLDSHSRRLMRTVQLFLAIRCLFAVLILVPGVARLGSLVEALFWFAAGIFAIVVAIGWAHRQLFRRGQRS
jgi:hypothetical protein